MAALKRLICAASELSDSGKGALFEAEYEGRTVPAFAVRFQGKVHAYLNRCAHVPMELDWRAGEFFDQSGLYLMCATHGAMYAPESGACLGGPCRGGALVPLSTEESNGEIFLVENTEDT
jgi:nitrite reductase/ring-hydroxylating ferredoxin subunit